MNQPNRRNSFRIRCSMASSSKSYGYAPSTKTAPKVRPGFRLAQCAHANLAWSEPPDLHRADPARRYTSTWLLGEPVARPFGHCFDSFIGLLFAMRWTGRPAL